MQHKFTDDTEKALPDNQVELADLCMELWDKCFELGNNHPEWNSTATKYNIAANAYNRNAGAKMMSPLNPDTINPDIPDDFVAAKPLAAHKPPKQQAPVQLAASGIEARSEPPRTLFGPGQYFSTTEPMPLTPEIEAIIKSEGSGADKIRAVYLLNPHGFNIADFERYTGINKGRIKGCLQKMDK